MPDELTTIQGLGDVPRDEWPTSPKGEEPVIDRLGPGTELHQKTLKYLLRRIELAEDEMERFYARWQTQEMKVQAYIHLPKWEEKLKELNDKGEVPRAVSVVIPLEFAIISTIVTYLLHTFTGRKPMFQVGTYKEESIEAAHYMETFLQFNADHVRLIKHLHQFFQDGQTYGVAVLMAQWMVERSKRTRIERMKQYSVFGQEEGEKTKKVRSVRTTFEGTEVRSIDPFLFFPDPRVPMSSVNEDGEFVFWRSFEGWHSLLKAEAEEDYKWVKKTRRDIPEHERTSQDSVRSLLAGGRSQPAMRVLPRDAGHRYGQIDQGTIEIIPRELGLGESEVPEKWLFSILNKCQIIQAEPFDADHGKHPVIVAEPYTMGYGFGHLGMSDYVGPLQDVASWFINSHMDNVRRVLNDVFVVDPTRIEMQDLKRPGPGKHIRLKRSAAGQDVRTVLQQLPIADVTRAHVQDFEMFVRIAQLLSSVSDNVLGLQDAGGRKTATEVRTSSEAAASRLAAQARIYSAQGIVDLTEMMSLNAQQNLTESFYLQVVGKEGFSKGMLITPEMLVGDFHYPIHDGTLPLDRVAMLDVWKELFLGVLKDQGLRQAYDIPKMFEFIAELGGARNIESMRLKVGGTAEEVAQQAQAGNLAPIGGPSSAINALGGPRPRNRAAGGL